MKLAILLKCKNVLLYGYGREGKATEAWLREVGYAGNIEIYDEGKAMCPKMPIEEYDVIVRSPGVPPHKMPAGPAITTATELFFSNLSPELLRKIIGITGTKGKSTTTKFTAECLQAAGKKVLLGGNYGVPLLSLWNELHAADYVVAELSSYQLEPLRVSPQIALCTNLYADHLDRHGDLKGYHAAKRNLWQHQAAGGVLFAPVHQKELFLENTPCLCEPLSQEVFPTNSLFQAMHWRQNFGLVQALFRKLELPPEVLTAVAQTFVGLPHRMQYVGNIADLDWYDDSISTNPHSGLAAVQTLGLRLGAMLIGGQNRQLDYAPLLAALAEMPEHPIIILLDAEIQPHLATLCEENGLMAYASTTMTDAVEYAQTHTKKGKAVLLSPSAPSFDRWPDFTKRGRAFQQCVHELEPQHGAA